MAVNGNQRRRILDMGKQGGIGGLAAGRENGAPGFQIGELTLRRRPDPNLDACRPSAAPCQFGEGVEGRRRGAESFEQEIERDRADIVAANQAQPVDFFGP